MKIKKKVIVNLGASPGPHFKAAQALILRLINTLLFRKDKEKL